MKISYYSPEAEVVFFENEDILTVNGSAMAVQPTGFWDGYDSYIGN